MPSLATRRRGAGSGSTTKGWMSTQVLSTRDLIAPDNVFFAATGVTGGEFLRAVDFPR